MVTGLSNMGFSALIFSPYQVTGSISRNSPDFRGCEISVMVDDDFGFSMAGFADVTKFFDLPVPEFIPSSPGIEYNLDPNRYRKIYTHMLQKPKKV